MALAVEAGLKTWEVDALYISEGWIHINAYVERVNRQWQIAESNQKWDFYMTRQICHTIYLHSMADSKIKSAERFMPSPWETEGKIASTPKEIWEEWEAKRVEREKRQKEREQKQ